MPVQSDKVAEIQELILAEAEAEAKRLREEATAEGEALLAKARREVDAEAAARERAAEEESERQRRGRLASASAVARSRLLASRSAVLEEAVQAVEQKLQTLRGHSGYPEFLKLLLQEAALALAPAEDLEVLIDARDEAIVNDDFLGAVEVMLTFSKNFAIRFTLSPERIHTTGGVLVRVKGSNVRCDNTFEERLRAARPELMQRVAAELLGPEQR